MLLNPFLVPRGDLGAFASRSAARLLAGESGQRQGDSPAAPAPEPLLRAPCFYNMFPREWRRQEREAERNAQAAARATVAAASSSAVATAASSAPVAASSLDAVVTPAASSSSSATPPPAVAPTLRLRARSPSRALCNLGSASARDQYALAFANAVVQRTTHVSGSDRTEPAINGQPPSPQPPGPGTNGLLGAPPPGPVVVQSASAHPGHWRFNKPVRDMGDYLSVLRCQASLALRNPHADPLDDPNFANHIAHQHEAQQQQQQQQQQAQAQAAAAAAPVSLKRRGSASGAASNQRSLSPPPAPIEPLIGTASPSALAAQPHRLTVDEADDLGDGPSSPVPLSMSFSSSPRRRPGLSGTRRPRQAKPSMQQFLASRNGNGALHGNNGNGSSETNGGNNSPPPPLISLSPPPTNDVTVPESKRQKWSHVRVPSSGPSASLAAAVAAADRLKRSEATSPTNTNSLTSTSTNANNGAVSTPPIATLLASMLAQAPRLRHADCAVVAKPSSTAAPPASAVPANAALAPLLLYRLETELATTPSRASRQSKAQLGVYVARVEGWFVGQMVSATTKGAHLDRTPYEAAFNRWLADLTRQVQQATGEGTPAIVARWQRVTEQVDAKASATT